MKLFQDSKGYIWIGTKGGFSRFDGVEFENYTLKDNLEEEYVDYFFEDAAGRVYVGNGYGISYMDKGKLIPMPVPKYLARSKYHVDNQQRIWISIRNGKIICIEDGEVLQAHPLAHLINQNETAQIMQQCSRTGNIWVKASDDKLVVWDIRSSRIHLWGLRRQYLQLRD
jgi:ligand-binding sensor domain-containing protein